MAETVGKNTLAASELRSYVERCERIDEEKKNLSEDRKAILAEAKARGFHTAGINYLIKVRKMKPHDRQEAEQIRDLYLHSMDMDAEPPLFRAISALAQDAAGGEKLLDVYLSIVPAEGDLIATINGKRVRLWRDKDGVAHYQDYTPPEPWSVPKTSVPPPTRKEVPNCTPEEAEVLGRAAAKDNQPVITNPFPHDDERRPRWDLGWRKETGNDGMGPGK